jgi:hypothetical protein
MRPLSWCFELLHKVMASRSSAFWETGKEEEHACSPARFSRSERGERREGSRTWIIFGTFLTVRAERRDGPRTSTRESSYFWIERGEEAKSPWCRWFPILICKRNYVGWWNRMRAEEREPYIPRYSTRLVNITCLLRQTNTCTHMRYLSITLLLKLTLRCQTH